MRAPRRPAGAWPQAPCRGVDPRLRLLVRVLAVAQRQARTARGRYARLLPGRCEAREALGDGAVVGGDAGEPAGGEPASERQVDAPLSPRIEELGIVAR